MTPVRRHHASTASSSSLPRAGPSPAVAAVAAAAWWSVVSSSTGSPTPSPEPVTAHVRARGSASSCRHSTATLVRGSAAANGSRSQAWTSAPRPVSRTVATPSPRERRAVSTVEMAGPESPTSETSPAGSRCGIRLTSRPTAGSVFARPTLPGPTSRMPAPRQIRRSSPASRVSAAGADGSPTGPVPRTAIAPTPAWAQLRAAATSWPGVTAMTARSAAAGGISSPLPPVSSPRSSSNRLTARTGPAKPDRRRCRSTSWPTSLRWPRPPSTSTERGRSSRSMEARAAAADRCARASCSADGSSSPTVTPKVSPSGSNRSGRPRSRNTSSICTLLRSVSATSSRIPRARARATRSSSSSVPSPSPWCSSSMSSATSATAGADPVDGGHGDHHPAAAREHRVHVGVLAAGPSGSRRTRSRRPATGPGSAGTTCGWTPARTGPSARPGRRARPRAAAAPRRRRPARRTARGSRGSRGLVTT